MFVREVSGGLTPSGRGSCHLFKVGNTLRKMEAIETIHLQQYNLCAFTV